MKLGTPKCPICSRNANYIIETLRAKASIHVRRGKAEYEGDSDMDWDSQMPVKSEDGTVTLGCGYHEWQSTMEEESDE